MLLVQPAISAANQLQHDFVFTRSFDRCCPTILLLNSSPACRCLISYGGAAPSNSAVVISTNGRKFPFAREKHDLIKPPLPQLLIIPNEKKGKIKKVRVPDNFNGRPSKPNSYKAKMTPYKELNEKEIDREIKNYGVNRDF
jgi:hypothetical protein